MKTLFALSLFTFSLQSFALQLPGTLVCAGVNGVEKDVVVLTRSDSESGAAAYNFTYLSSGLVLSKAVLKLEESTKEKLQVRGYTDDEIKPNGVGLFNLDKTTNTATYFEADPSDAPPYHKPFQQVGKFSECKVFN